MSAACSSVYSRRRVVVILQFTRLTFMEMAKFNSRVSLLVALDWIYLI